MVTITFPNGTQADWIPEDKYVVWHANAQARFKNNGDAWDYANVSSLYVWQYGAVRMNDVWWRAMVGETVINGELVSPHKLIILRPKFVGRGKVRRFMAWMLGRGHGAR